MHPWAVAPPLHAATPSTAYRGLPSSRSPLDGRPQTPPSCCAAGSRAPCRVSAQRLRRWWTCCCDFAGRRRGWATAPVPRNPGLCVPAHCVSAGSSGNCAVAWRPARRRSGPSPRPALATAPPTRTGADLVLSGRPSSLTPSTAGHCASLSHATASSCLPPFSRAPVAAPPSYSRGAGEPPALLLLSSIRQFPKFSSGKMLCFIRKRWRGWGVAAGDAARWRGRGWRAVAGRQAVRSGALAGCYFFVWHGARWDFFLLSGVCAMLLSHGHACVRGPPSHCCVRILALIVSVSFLCMLGPKLDGGVAHVCVPMCVLTIACVSAIPLNPTFPDLGGPGRQWRLAIGWF
ncbi:hypothetical protein BS78_06G018600 [Paspalum vaginatum]|nr:hypothetical protein BS78_06G018600 [Paspalum vaginatum]